MRTLAAYRGLASFSYSTAQSMWVPTFNYVYDDISFDYYDFYRDIDDPLRDS